MERLKVFLSSTQTDLQAERDGAESLISELGHQCLRAESLDAPGTSPEAACRDMARSCDIYVGIFGARYGYMVPSLGISATEMEYHEARNTDPAKVLIYVQDVMEYDPEQERFLAEVQSFSDGYFRHQKFADCDTLRKQLRRDMITWTTRKVRQSLEKSVEVEALRDKVAHLSRIMELYKIPGELR